MLIANAQELILLVAGPKGEVPRARIFGDPFPKNGDGSLQLKTAPSLAEARKWLGRTTCSAVLIDVKCAVRIPSKTLRNFRARAPEIPLIILCEKRDSARAAALVRSGAADYLVTTGLTPSAAQALIRRSIDLFQTRREIRRLKSQLKSGQDAMSQLQIQLVEAEKLDSLGQMAAGVAHEVKNPLAILQMGVEFFAQIPSSHPSQAKVLGKMKDAVHRADRIISDMVDFSRSNGLELALESVNASLRRAVNLTSHIWRHGTVEIVEELTAPLPPVRIDRSKIDQLFVNLIANAVHAMPAGGQITIRSYAGEISHLLQDEAPPHFAPLQIGDNVVVAEVRDFGSGIPEELLERVFDPFFTTKPTGKGTGLGLSVCRTIAHLHSGMLLIKNAVPSGVRAQLILPDATTTPPQSRRGKATP